MSALVCGKRSSLVFDEIVDLSPSPSSKRICCAFSGDSASLRIDSSSGHGGGDLFASQIAHLRWLFPRMDQQLIEQVLDSCGNDLDSAIKRLSALSLESTEINLTFAMTNAGAVASSQPTEGCINGDGNSMANPPCNSLPKDGSEWVELFVGEMMNASDMDDARARAARALACLEKSIVARADTEAVQNFQKENNLLKEKVQVLIRENTILKRAVAIQYERQKEYTDKSQEMQHLRQLASQYQEQLRTLEVNNYALTMHLRQAQQSNSIPGRFHPDVF